MQPTLTSEQWNILVRAAQDEAELAKLFDGFRDRLKRIVSASIDQRLSRRIDASDILQETFVEASTRINEYLAKPNVSLFIWFRFLAKQRLAIMHRQNLSVQARDVRREIHFGATLSNSQSNAMLAMQLAARLTSVSATISKKELRQSVQLALDKLDDKSREILLLRHYEQLSNAESAEVLQISTTAASNRYIRALEKLKVLLQGQVDKFDVI